MHPGTRIRNSSSSNRTAAAAAAAAAAGAAAVVVTLWQTADTDNDRDMNHFWSRRCVEVEAQATTDSPRRR